MIEREMVAVKAWLKSDKQFHVMRDHVYHEHPVMAGLWGARWGHQHDNNNSNNTTRDWVSQRLLLKLGRLMIANMMGQNSYGSDQKVLAVSKISVCLCEKWDV